MDRNMKEVVIAAGVSVIVVAVVFSGLYIYAGLWPPFSVVESGSMQHSDLSSLETIDTGDMVVVRDPGKVEIRTYVEGWHDGYRKFGDYGDVIIFERGGNMNPIIHRAVLWLEWNGDGTWSAPSLKDYPYWEATSGTDETKLSGTLTFTDYGFRGQTISLDLDRLATVSPESGYATKGDNNQNFDFTLGIAGVGGLISEERILYVAGFTIPWVGTIKLYLSGNQAAIDAIPPNSVPNMICAIAAVIVWIASLFVMLDYISWYRNRDREG